MAVFHISTNLGNIDVKISAEDDEFFLERLLENLEDQDDSDYAVETAILKTLFEEMEESACLQRIESSFLDDFEKLDKETAIARIIEILEAEKCLT